MTRKLSENIYKTINNRVKLFLNTNNDVESWDSEDNQTTFKQLIKNLLKKNDKLDKPDNLPKKPSTAYICFCTSEMSNFKENNPDLNNRELMSGLSKEWNKIKGNDSKIHRFKEMAILDKERYQKEMTEFKKENPEAEKNQQVKKPKSNYLFYCGENRALIVSENKDLNPKQVMSKLGDGWKKLKLEGGEKLKYYDGLAATDKERYLQEKENSKGEEVVEKPKKKTTKSKKEKTEDGGKKKKTKEEVVVEEVEEVEEEEEEEKPSKKKTKTKVEKKSASELEVENKPKKLNGYIKYLNANRESYKNDNPSISSKTITQELALQWKQLSEEEKKFWKDK